VINSCNKTNYLNHVGKMAFGRYKEHKRKQLEESRIE